MEHGRFIRETKDELKSRRLDLATAFAQTQGASAYLAGLAASTDAVLRKVWDHLGLEPLSTLVAVGGYGRGELFPHSDVDVLIVLPDCAEDSARTQVETAVSLLWDIGLELGHSVRTVNECFEQAKIDLTIATALLEARWLSGPKKPFYQLRNGLIPALDREAFARGKLLEMRQRHTKYQDTPYSLEPNCKESPGGLRDLQVVLWITQAFAWGRKWSDLAQNGLITAHEARYIRIYERRIKQIRIHLHLAANRREDRLVFDLQTAVAERMGDEATRGRRTSEVLMQRYYLAAKAITQLNAILLSNIGGRIFSIEPSASSAQKTIDNTFFINNGLLDIVTVESLEKNPQNILRAFRVMQQHPEITGMSATLLRALWNARERMSAAFRRDPINRQIFMEIISSPAGVTRALRQMNQWGILGRYLPAFRKVVGRMQHDLFHIYTVDQHTLMVIRNLRRFTLAEHAHENPLCSHLIGSFERPWVLTVAALFHDIAKGRGGDHSVLGTVDAARFCRESGITGEDAELIPWLVRNHLTMSHTAQKQDLSDPETIETFAKVVGNERRLAALYLLTVADIRGTSPKVWNSWKGRLLEELYRSTRQVLSGEQWNPQTRMDDKKCEALRLLRLHGYTDDWHQTLWRELDEAFFLRHDAASIAWLTRSLRRSFKTTVPVVKARVNSIGNGVDIAVYSPDQSDLFARICSYFDVREYGIQEARIHTTRNGYALDTFIVEVRDMPQSHRELATMIEAELQALLADPRPLPKPSKGRISRQSKTFPVAPTVNIRPDDKGQYYVLSVLAADRTGLLYSIAAVLAKHHVDVRTARIMTLGERIEDIFLISGSQLNGSREQIELESDLLAAVSA